MPKPHLILHVPQLGQKGSSTKGWQQAQTRHAMIQKRTNKLQFLYIHIFQQASSQRHPMKPTTRCANLVSRFTWPLAPRTEACKGVCCSPNLFKISSPDLGHECCITVLHSGNCCLITSAKVKLCHDSSCMSLVFKLQ